MSSEHLESYLSGRWVRGEGVETRLVDPVKGDELAMASSKGVDLTAAHKLFALQAHAITAGDESAELELRLPDVTPFAAKGPRGGADIWRISTAPAHGPEVGRTLADKAGAEMLYDWAGGLVWAALPRSDDAQAPLVHATVAAVGGHATLIRAPAAVRAKVDVFPPEPPALAALTRRVRKGFDPQGVLNAGRMWAGV